MANRERVLAERKQWYAANREKVRAERRARYAANREKVLAKYKARSETEREKKRALEKDWRDRNRPRQAEKVSRRRARLYGAIVEPIPTAALDAIRTAPCTYCGRPATAEKPSTVDHVIPLGPPHHGPHTMANLTSACRRCNNRKKTKTAEEFRALLKEEAK